MPKKNPVSTSFQKVVARPPYKHPMLKPREMGPLLNYMKEHEGEGKTTEELILEFREECGHDFREIAFLIKNGRRHTYQTCRLCHVFETASRSYHG